MSQQRMAIGIRNSAVPSGLHIKVLCPAIFVAIKVLSLMDERHLM
jgi:hypothetical protein